MTSPVTEIAAAVMPLFMQPLPGDPPLLLPAEDARAQLGGLLTPGPAGQPRPGVLPAAAGYAGEITLGVNAFTVAPFVAVLPGRLGAQGSYVAGWRTAGTLNSTLPPAGQFRGVQIVAELRDSVYDAGTKYDLHLYVLHGTPAATAGAVVQPTVPAWGLSLGAFVVDSAGVISTVATFRLPRAVAAGGIRPVDYDDAAVGVSRGQYRDRYLSSARTAARLERWNTTTGGWEPVAGRYWGTVAGATFPAAVDGVQPGDILYASAYLCHLVWDVSSATGVATWHQAGSPVQVDSATGGVGGIRGYIAQAAAAGVSAWHNGFLVFDNTLDRLYVAKGGTAFELVGGHAGARVTTAWAAAANWTVAAQWVRNLGNGMAEGYAEFTRTVSAITVPATGDITNTAMGTVPAGWEPDEFFPLLSSGAGRMAASSILASGVVQVMSTVPGADIAVGNVISVNGVWRLADAATSASAGYA